MFGLARARDVAASFPRKACTTRPYGREGKGGGFPSSRAPYSSYSHATTTTTTTTTSTTDPRRSSSTIVEPFGRVLESIDLFRNGLSRLFDDYRVSLRIREAELTRQFLRRRIRQRMEGRRPRSDDGRRSIMLRSIDGEGRASYALLRRLPKSSNATRYGAMTGGHDDSNNNHRSGRRHRSPLYQERRPSPSSNRRSLEHLRRISRDLSISLPTAAGFVLVPFVGYGFLFLGMAFPRLLLSRQFHTKEQRLDFATSEYRRRLVWYAILSGGDFWGCCMINVPGLTLISGPRGGDDDEEEEDGGGPRTAGPDYDDGHDIPPPSYLRSLTYLEMDAAGPVFDERSMLTLYDLIRRNFCRGCTDEFDGGGKPTSAMCNLQSSHIHHLSLSNNLASSLLLPPAFAPYFLQICLPRMYLERRLMTIAEDVILDDAALIEEGRSSSGGEGEYCVGMTDEEVFDACWLRGLPLGRFAVADRDIIDDCDTGNGGDGEVITATRKVLANHLRMMEVVMSVRLGPMMTTSTVAKRDKGLDVMGSLRPRGELVRDTMLHLLVLHLPAIRYGLGTKGVINI